MNYDDFYDKVLGGWIGKCAGGILGAPIEGFKNFNTIPYSDKLFDTNFANDDLDLQILWLDMLLKKGFNVHETDFKEHWLEHVDFPWCEYGIATRNLKLGLDVPDSGKQDNEFWKTGMGSPIRSEIWGMVNPGMPGKAAAYAKIDSSLDHYGFSVNAEQYLSACASIAFFEKDINVVLNQGLQYIPETCDCKLMIEEVMLWSRDYEFDIVAGKIKSKYGDADFTNAPMNVAFIVLSLLRADNNFDFLIDALHLGHDSDCIVATAGALLGIVLGYKNIPKVWKERVGNELLVSPEITGIYCPKTITELSQLTCQAAQLFAKGLGNTNVEFEEEINLPNVVSQDYSLFVEVDVIPRPNLKQAGKLKVFYENLSSQSQMIQLKLNSKVFASKEIRFTVDSLSKKTSGLDLEISISDFTYQQTSMPYELELTIDERVEKIYYKGIPYPGNWLLLGPFIEDDPSIAQQNKEFPDHGLPSLPSIEYMNHDRINSEIDFVDTSSINNFLNDKSIFDQPFHTCLVFPTSMKIDLKESFYGKGERTLYLYTEVSSSKDQKKWLVIGSTSMLTIWHNTQKLYESKEVKRRWPMGHITELNLTKGSNKLLIRLDIILDDFEFEVGLKEHRNKHPHQTQWETELQFNVLNSI